MPIDWSLARVPDIAGNALAGYQAGNAMRQDRERRNALAAYAQNPDTGYNALLQADPATAIALRREGRDNLASKDTEDTATRQRHMLGTRDVLMGALDAPEDQRHAVLAQLIQQRSDVWSPEEQQKAIDALSGPNVDLSTPRLTALVHGFGGDTAPQQRMNIAEREQNLREKDTWNDNSREDARFAEQRRAGRVSEGYEGARVGIARQGMQYEGQRLTLAQQAEQRQREQDLARMEREANDPSTVFGSILARTSRGETLTPGEQRAYDMYLNAHRAPDPYGASPTPGAGGDEYGAAPPPSPSAVQPSAPPPVNNMRGQGAPAPANSMRTRTRPVPAAGADQPVVVRREIRRGTVAADRPAPGGAIPTPHTEADFARVPIGGQYRDPGDGQIYTRRH